MSGHPIPPIAASVAEAKAVPKLGQLFDEHDAMFLLMDLKVSQWLPSVLKKLQRAR